MHDWTAIICHDLFQAHQMLLLDTRNQYSMIVGVEKWMNFASEFRSVACTDIICPHSKSGSRPLSRILHIKFLRKLS